MSTYFGLLRHNDFSVRGLAGDQCSRVAFARSGSTQIELSEGSGRKGDPFRAVEAASKKWNGPDPIRDMRKVPYS